MHLIRGEINTKKRQLTFFLLAVSLLVFIDNASARGGVFVIEPMQEATDIVELTALSTDVAGKVSVSDGLIDFYVTSPSGNVLLCFNKTASTSFKFDADENGVYVLHLANTGSENNVTATLDYGVNYEFTFVEQTNVIGHVRGPDIIVVAPPAVINPIEILTILSLVVSTILSVAKLGDKVLKLLRWLYWRSKHGKSKTPVVVSPPV